VRNEGPSAKSSDSSRTRGSVAIGMPSMMRMSTGKSRRSSLSGPGKQRCCGGGRCAQHDRAARLLRRIRELGLPALDFAARTAGAQQERVAVLRQLGASSRPADQFNAEQGFE